MRGGRIINHLLAYLLHTAFDHVYYGAAVEGLIIAHSLISITSFKRPNEILRLHYRVQLAATSPVPTTLLMALLYVQAKHMRR